MRDHPGLASCAVECRHCGIRFLTHPRNANRQDLLCPFGCREHHRRQQANERSKRHYRTDKGRRKKKRLNGKRSAALGSGEHGMSPDAVVADVASAVQGTSSAGASSASLDAPWERERASQPAPHPTHPPALQRACQATPHLTHPPVQVALEETSGEDVLLTLEGFTLDDTTLVKSPMLSYLAMVASVIEGRPISREELLQVLRRSMRQRSFDRQSRREYILRVLNQHPP